MKTALKFLFFVIITTFLTMCNSKKNNENSSSKVDNNFEWLVGQWKRTNEEKGKETFENWQKISSSKYSGLGFTMQNNDTISQETMTLLETNGKWQLLVKTPNEKEFTKFEMSKVETESFECKNDSLDFPKFIKYWKTGEKMNAIVSGDSLKLSFEFAKMK